MWSAWGHSHRRGWSEGPLPCTDVRFFQSVIKVNWLVAVTIKEGKQSYLGLFCFPALNRVDHWMDCGENWTRSTRKVNINSYSWKLNSPVCFACGESSSNSSTTYCHFLIVFVLDVVCRVKLETSYLVYLQWWFYSHCFSWWNWISFVVHVWITYVCYFFICNMLAISCVKQSTQSSDPISQLLTAKPFHSVYQLHFHSYWMYRVSKLHQTLHHTFLSSLQ